MPGVETGRDRGNIPLQLVSAGRSEESVGEETLVTQLFGAHPKVTRLRRVGAKLI